MKLNLAEMKLNHAEWWAEGRECRKVLLGGDPKRVRASKRSCSNPSEKKPKLYKHKIDINGTILDGYHTFDHVPVTKCLDFIYGLAGISATKQLTRNRGINEGR